MFNRIPVPAGEYMFKLLVGAYNEWKADVKAYFSIRLNKRERWERFEINKHKKNVVAFIISKELVVFALVEDYKTFINCGE